jgi:hypothetical protein
MQEMAMPQIAGYLLSLKQIEDFCRKYGVAEFSLFGSVLRDELSAMFGGREIDLVQKRLLIPNCTMSSSSLALPSRPLITN